MTKQGVGSITNQLSNSCPVGHEVLKPMKSWIIRGFVLTIICSLVLLQHFSSLTGSLDGRPRREKTAANNKQNVLIIITQTRSGSSFTGEVFAATKNSMYIYEPLYPYGFSCQSFPVEKQLLLKQLLNCDFSRLQAIYEDGFNKSKSKDHADCKNNGLCFVDASAGLLHRYRRDCQRTFQKDQHGSEKCDYPLKADVLATMCRSSEFIITKVVRLCTVEQLEDTYDFLKNEGKNVFILHLVRDLRSIASSNLKISQNKDTTNIANAIVRGYCNRQRMQLDYIKRHSHESRIISDGRYIRIRYEDISTDPVATATKVFKFMGFSSLSSEIIDNIHNHLQPSINDIEWSRQKAKFPAKVARLLREYRDPFGVVRDPKKILDQWRTLLPFEAISQIQEKCRDVLEEMGYVIFDNQNQVKNLSLLSFAIT